MLWTKRGHGLVITLFLLGAPLSSARAAKTTGDRVDDRTVIAVTPIMTRGPIESTEVEGLELVLGAALQREPRVRAIMPSEIQTLLGIEAQKQLLGCESDTSCLAEIGGALGAPYVLSLQVSRVGSTWILQLSLLDAASNQTLTRATREVDGIDPLVSALKSAVKESIKTLPLDPLLEASSDGAATDPEASTATGPTRKVTPPGKRGRILFWAGLGAGVALIGGGGVLWRGGERTLHWHALAAKTLVEGQPLPDDLKDSLLTQKQVDAGVLQRGLGAGVAALGLALIAADLLYATVFTGPSTSVTFAPLPGGGSAVFTWRLP